MPQQHYVIEGGRKGKERLDLLAGIFRPATLSFLDSVGLSPGMRCLDVGCGGGHVVREMAGRVGPAGEAVGVDFDPEILKLAAADARAQGLENARFELGDVLDFTLPGGRDLVYARCLLTHLVDPAKALAAMVAAAKPGAVVAVEDIDMGGHFAHPPNAAFDAFLTLYRQAARQRGADPDIGRRLPALFRAAGLTDLRITLSQVAHEADEGKWLTPITMERIAPAVLASGLADEAEIERIARGLEAATRDPETMIVLPRIFQVSGRVPG